MTEPPPWSDHDFVFVAGMHRSGTTLLANAIGSSATAAGLTGTGVRMDEGQFLQGVFPIGRQLGGVTRWAFDERAYLDERNAAEIPDAAARLWRSWSPYWDLGAQHLVEKTPLNLTRTRFLQAVFPQSKFVVITRHPITQALAVRKWSPARHRKFGYAFPSLVEHWLRAHEAFRADSAHLRHVHVVRFEDLVSAPQHELERVQQFLGFEVAAEQFDEVDALRALRYARDWSGAVDNGGAMRALGSLCRRSNFVSKRAVREALKDSTEQALFPRYARTIARRYGVRISALGYHMAEFDLVDPWL